MSGSLVQLTDLDIVIASCLPYFTKKEEIEKKKLEVEMATVKVLKLRRKRTISDQSIFPLFNILGNIIYKRSD